MTLEEAKAHVEKITQALASIITVVSPVMPGDAFMILKKLEDRGYSLVPTNLIVRNHELSMELQEKQAYNNQQKDIIIKGQAARIAQLEALLGVEKEEPEDKNQPVMWVSRESA